MFKKKILILAVSAFAIANLLGCSKVPKENQVQVVQENSETKDIAKIDKKVLTDGINPFYSTDALNVKENRNQIPLTLSKDKKYVYYMKPSIAKPKAEEYTIIKGEALCKVDIIKVNLETADTKQVAINVPFVSSVKWNKEWSIVAFLGGNTLTVYNDDADKLVQSFLADGNGITSFGWSPDSKKIYTEGQGLVNSGIYYLDSKKYVHSYETKENIFYKGVLDGQYLYATERLGDDTYNTVIVDKNNKILNRINSSAKFRDSYKTSVLQIGKNNFGLEYYADINEGSAIILSNEYINDAKFIYNGGIAYITPNDNPEENSFYLHILSSKGEELNKILVSGSTIMLLPDGKTGYVGGNNIERVDLINYALEGTQQVEDTKDRESIIKTLRGAMDVIYKYEIVGEKDIARAKKYFIDSSNPEQWALTDVTNMFKENIKLSSETLDYSITLRLKNLNVGSGKAMANISVTAFNSFGTGLGMSNTVELIKREDTWYVTGLSTFPGSKQYSEVKAKVEGLVKDAQKGMIFNGQLKDKEIQLGQIQFWQLSEPHLADNIESANYCKVYLKVKENGEYVLYKLILDKKNQSYWKESGLSKDNLSRLF